jgi:hypothetical protein
LQKSQNVREIVSGIRQQCRRTGNQSVYDFNYYECDIENQANRERAPEAMGRMIMAMMLLSLMNPMIVRHCP